MAPEREVLDRLVRIETKLDGALLAESDHELRLRVLEARRWPLAVIGGICGVVGAVCAAVAMVMQFKGA